MRRYNMSENRKSNRESMPVPPIGGQVVEEPIIAQDEIPAISNKPAESDSVKIIKSKSPKGIEVVALQNGYFQNCRKVEGDRFFISDMSKLGKWMKCVDPKIEAQHQENQKAKKQELLGK